MVLLVSLACGCQGRSIGRMCAALEGYVCSREQKEERRKPQSVLLLANRDGQCEWHVRERERERGREEVLSRGSLAKRKVVVGNRKAGSPQKQEGTTEKKQERMIGSVGRVRGL